MERAVKSTFHRLPVGHVFLLFFISPARCLYLVLILVASCCLVICRRALLCMHKWFGFALPDPPLLVPRKYLVCSIVCAGRHIIHGKLRNILGGRDVCIRRLRKGGRCLFSLGCLVWYWYAFLSCLESLFLYLLAFCLFFSFA